MKLVSFILFALFVYVSSAITVGSQRFYAELTLTNKEYGSGAAFDNFVWFDSIGKNLRIDYYSRGTKFMTVYYNYTSGDKYQFCGNNCSRATWTGGVPSFYGSNFVSLTPCGQKDWNGPSTCNLATCTSFATSPTQANGILSLSFSDPGTNTKICMARWTPASGYTYGPEWHFNKFVNSNYGAGEDPTVASVYTDLFTGKSCPAPSCQSKLDIAIVLDESGSIFSPTNFWPNVQDFATKLLQSLDIRPGFVRAGVVFFSGLGDCNNNQTLSGSIISCTGGCGECGGEYNTKYSSTDLVTDPTPLFSAVKNNGGDKGFTCISCGLERGMNLLNRSPQSGIQKIIIMMTDGEGNRVTNGIARMATATKNSGIRNIVLGVTSSVNSGQILQFTDPQDFYKADNFNQLNSFIETLTKTVCESLPPIETCDFCSGICSCQANCNCPSSCDDYNACTIDTCDPNPISVQGGTAGYCLSSPKTCTDTNVCTKNLCNPASGCDFTQFEPLPADFNYCFGWECDANVGNRTKDVGATKCVQTSDLCLVKYCNYTSGNTGGLKGSCITHDLNVLQYGSSQTYKLPDNTTNTVYGCGRPTIDPIINAPPPPCLTYSCNSATGGCVRNPSACQCLSNSQCNDNDGCTTDTCDLSTGTCVYSKIDCWSELSNKGCNVTVSFTGSSQTGDSYYSSGAQVQGTPSAANRGCDALACYGGQRSTYTCLSTSATSHTCSRSFQNCPSTSCQDSICQTTGAWYLDSSNNYQATTNCGKTVTLTCTDTDSCTDNYCNSTWSGQTCSAPGTCYQQTSPSGNRCITVNNGTTCNDNSVCTTDSCDSATGCKFVPKNLPNNYCYDYSCDPVKGNISVVNSNCAQGPDLCQVQFCDPTGNNGLGACVTIDKTTLAFGSSQTITDATGTQRIISGCNRPDNGCYKYGCDSLTGQCTTNTSTCDCTNQNHTQCNDYNGCTIDTCEPNNTCSYRNVDCWNIMSGGGCNASDAVSTSTDVANTLYNYQIANNDYTTPSFPSGPTYPNINCSHMACFGGQRSEYICQSQGDYSPQCVRSTSDCTKGGCQDNICRSLNTWTNGQLDTDCFKVFEPSCVSNKCNVITCNTDFVFGQDPSTRCLTQNNASLCVDGNLCTRDGICDNTTGCDYSQATTAPGVNGTCTTYLCNNVTGWYSQANICSAPSSACSVTYCNTTNDQCVQIDRMTYERGQTEYYVDQFGSVQSISGCNRPSTETFTCRTYKCNDTTGECYIDASQCVCFGDEFCFDGNPCTVDTCINGGSQCKSERVDCYSRLSNDNCRINVNFSPGTATGINQYYGNSTVDVTSLDANGLPSPNNRTRSCDELACYNGQRSFYDCSGTAENVYSCQRQTIDCLRNGCKDEICRSLGNWTDLHANTDCGNSFIPQCADDNACTNDFCNSDWKPNQSSTLRCIHQPVDGPTFCDDGNFCTRDYCDEKDTTGDVCKHSLYSDNYLRKNICTNGTKCQNVDCTVNRCTYTEKVCKNPTLCFFYKCNSTTNGNCGVFPTGVYVLDRCGVCGGNGLSCQVLQPVPNKNSIAVALGVGLGVGLVFAFIILGLIFKKSYSMYQALGTEIQGTVTNAQTYKGGDNHIDTSHYNHD